MCQQNCWHILLDMKVFVISIIVLILSGCTGENVSLSRDPYTFTRPANFPPSVYTFNNNPVTKEGFELGRMLFYDPILSADKTIACANCHQQARSFSDPVHRLCPDPGASGTTVHSCRCGLRRSPVAIKPCCLRETFRGCGIAGARRKNAATRSV